LQSDNGLMVIVHQDETLFRKERNNSSRILYVAKKIEGRDKAIKSKRDAKIIKAVIISPFIYSPWMNR
jgi:hypothetical protein